MITGAALGPRSRRIHNTIQKLPAPKIGARTSSGICFLAVFAQK